MRIKRFLFYSVILISFVLSYGCKKNEDSRKVSSAHNENRPYIQEVEIQEENGEAYTQEASSYSEHNQDPLSVTTSSGRAKSASSKTKRKEIIEEVAPNNLAVYEPTISVGGVNKDEVVGLQNQSSFRFEIFATSGGVARFLEGQELSKNLGQDCYEAIAAADEGYYFDHWEVIQGRPLTPVTLSRIMVQGFSGTVLKAHFIKESELIYVSKQGQAMASAALGSRALPFASLEAAVSEAKNRIESNDTQRVELRVAVGDYLLQDHSALELISGISIIGGFNQDTWELLVANKAAQTIIRITRAFSPSAMIFINSGQKDNLRAGRVTLAGLVIDGSSAPVVLVSANGVTPRITQCVLKGYGEALVSCFDSGAEIDTNQFVSFSDSGIVLDVAPIAKQNVVIAQNSILMGSKQRALAQGIGIRINSPKNSDMVKVRVANNQIKASISKSFTGIKIDNSFMVCEGNRIETVNGLSEFSKGMELQGEAVVNGNTILLDSREGYGVSLQGNGHSGRILNNTIITKSMDINRSMTACGEIVGVNLLVSNNIFVNPEAETAAALGSGVLHVGNRVYNNCIISNNAEEKRLIVGVNGNVDQLFDDSIKYAINKGGVELSPQF